MTVTLVLNEATYQTLVAAARDDVESAAVLVVTVNREDAGDVRLLEREIVWAPEDTYVSREADRLDLPSHAWVPALAMAERDGAAALFVHTHPGDGSRPLPSLHDRQVDADVADVFRIRTGTNAYGSLIVAPSKESLVFGGHLDLDGEASHQIDRLWVVGDRLTLISHYSSSTPELDNAFDRNIRAFGGGVQRMLGELAVAVVGCGGTGSAVAEQLVRLGVRHLRLFDPDDLSGTNVTRVYGSTPDDVGRNKTDVVAEHLRAIAPDIEVLTTPDAITRLNAARTLAHSDVIFGCTDDNAGRIVLSRLATFFMTPIFDCGVLLSSNERQQLVGIDGRVTYMAPGSACLVCRGRVDTQRAAAELMTPEEHQRLAGEGYAPALAGVEPAVVTFTTLVAATAVSELLERLTRFGPEPAPNEVLLRCHEREVSTNVQLPRLRHYCHPESRKIGRGITDPFLEIAWTT